MTPSSTHLVLIPSYNTGPKVYETVSAARANWDPVWVVVDGSDDGTAEGLLELASGDPGLAVHVLPVNVGKGAAVLHGPRGGARSRLQPCVDDGFGRPASRRPDRDLHGGFDSASAGDGPRPAGFRRLRTPAARARPQALELWTHLETLGAGVDDSLYGFRVYPIEPLDPRHAAGSAGCAASTSTPRPSSACLARRARRQHRRPGQVPDGRRRRAFPTSATCATTCC
jgi:hypothetical protein